MRKVRYMEKREKKRKQAVALIGLGLALAMAVSIFWFVGRPMLEFVSQPEQFRAWVDSHGVWGRLAVLGMMMFQVFVAIIPGEPLEIGAGYAFGAVEGTLLCVLATSLSGILIFLIVKKFGMRFVTLFVSEEKIHSLKFLQNTHRLNLIAFLLFFIPGTPKDVLTYVVGLTPMRLSTWIFITTVACWCTGRSPSTTRKKKPCAKNGKKGLAGKGKKPVSQMYNILNVLYIIVGERGALAGALLFY